MINKLLNIKNIRKADISGGMFGLYFEDTNYSDDFGIYAEMIENRAFEYAKKKSSDDETGDSRGRLYGWHAYPLEGLSAELKIDTVDPVDPLYPHYLSFTSTVGQLGFMNRAYGGIRLRKGISYKISCFMRTREEYDGTVEVGIFKDGVERTCALLAGHVYADWRKYEAILELTEDIDDGEFVIMLSYIGNVDFDYISMVPEDAVAGVFRKDLVDYLAKLGPKFIRFPIGYNYHSRRKNVGAFEYFKLCEYMDVSPIPVMNVGLWDTDTTSDTLEGYIRSTLAFIEFARGGKDSSYGSKRCNSGHAKPFPLHMLKIGNDAHETNHPEYLERYAMFEKAIHTWYPHMKLIGSAGSSFTNEYGRKAIEFFRENQVKNPNFVYAIDLNQLISREWRLNNQDIFAKLPKELQYSFCAYTDNENDRSASNTLAEALGMAGYMTNLEKNADVICMANHCPVIGRVDYNPLTPYLIRFDDTDVFGTPAYYVMQMYAGKQQDYTLQSEIREDSTDQRVYHTVTYSPTGNTVSIKIINPNADACTIRIDSDNLLRRGDYRIIQTILTAADAAAQNTLEHPNTVIPVTDSYDADEVRELVVKPYSFTLFQIEM